MTRRRNLAEWLDYQQRIHPRSVELGLERVGEVWRRMGAPRIAPVVITVGGTNGKGSTVAFLEAMLSAAGKRVGCYTSPHLLHYNERIRVLGRDVDDEPIVAAFDRIEDARGEIALTYFEFGTLAALWIFAQSGLDAAVLEVGLGGRLDAVNIIDADAAIVTTIDLDHQDWLGNDRDSIGREKAGIFRAGKPAIIGEVDPPPSLLAEAERIGAVVFRSGSDFRAERRGSTWDWIAETAALGDLPLPTLVAPIQIGNAAAAISALYFLRDRLGWSGEAIAAGVRNAQVSARLQRIDFAAGPELIIDVAHNPQAAQVLARWLAQNPIGGRTFGVFGALADKDVAGIAAPLASYFSRWFAAGLEADTPRGLTAADLSQRVQTIVPAAEITSHSSVAAALDAAVAEADGRDRVIAFGSFFVAAGALTWAATQQGAIQREAVLRQV